MTISDKIRIYELSRDLNLENKDILDAAQKLSISVKSHSSSISAEEAKKIKNLINKKNSDKKILSINKPSIKKDNYKNNRDDKTSVTPSVKEKPLRDNLHKKPLLTKPLNKPESLKIISNEPKNPNKPTMINSSQSRANQNIKNKPSQNLIQEKTLRNNTTPPTKSPAKPPIQLIAKPKNINNNFKSNQATQNISNSIDKKRISGKPDQNINKPKTKNNNSRFNPPELVGAPIRRDDSNQQNNNKRNISFKQSFPNRAGTPNRAGMPNRPGVRNKPYDQSRSNSFNRQDSSNRPGAPSRPGMPNNRPGSRNKTSDQGRPGSYKQTNPNRPGASNRPGHKFNGPKSSGIRKPVSPNELLQLQKTNKSENDKRVIKTNEKQNIETTKQNAKAPSTRPNAVPSSKKPPHRPFSNSSKKPGKADWDDSAKLEALRSKNPQKQRQKVHIIGDNDDSLTSETSGYSGEKISILSASLARPKKEKSDDPKSQ